MLLSHNEKLVIKPWSAESESLFFRIFIDRKLAISARCSPDSKNEYRICQVSTEEGFREKGYLKKMVHIIKCYCIVCNYSKIILTASNIADVDSDTLVKIYTKVGFNSSEDNKYKMYMELHPI